MSIIICYECEKRVDTDFEEYFDIEGYKFICLYCKEEKEEE